MLPELEAVEKPLGTQLFESDQVKLSHWRPTPRRRKLVRFFVSNANIINVRIMFSVSFPGKIASLCSRVQVVYGEDFGSTQCNCATSSGPALYDTSPFAMWHLKAG